MIEAWQLSAGMAPAAVGSRLGRRLPALLIRGLIVTVGLATSIAFFLKS